ncbi:MAG: type II toxin-antitoxin system VapC family toxin [Burkholderiaceae bacterium]
MKLADTCVWVELLADTPTGRRYRSLFATPEQVLVPTLVLFELRRWALRELGDADADRVMAATRNAHIVPLVEATALLAAELTVQYKLPALDALIYASALHHGATLITCDAHFEALPGVEYRAKATA